MFSHRRVAIPLNFFRDNILTGTLPNWGSNAGGVGKSRFSANICMAIGLVTAGVRSRMSTVDRTVYRTVSIPGRVCLLCLALQTFLLCL